MAAARAAPPSAGRPRPRGRRRRGDVANASAFLCAYLAATNEAPLCLEEGEGGTLRCAALVRVCLGDDIGEPPNLPAIEVLTQLLILLRNEAPGSAVLGTLLEHIEADIERFFAALAAPSPLPARIARFIPNDAFAYRPRGELRRKLLLLLEECLRSERPGLVLPLVELGLFHIAADLLLLPHTCNALHMRASAVLEWAIGVAHPAIAPAVHASLFTDVQLTQRLLALVSEYAPPPKGPTAAGAASAPSAADGGADAAAAAGLPPKRTKKILPCCHVFVMHLGACLLTAAQREPSVRGLLEACEEWEPFIAPGGALTIWEAAQSRPLGGLAPTRHSDDDSDEDDDDTEAVAHHLASISGANYGGGGGDRSRSNDDDDDDDDEGEGQSSSEYLQHFAQYLRGQNPFNQTLPPPPSEAWSAEFDADFDGGSPSSGGDSPAGGASTGGFEADFDADGGGGGGGSGGGGGGGGFADFSSMSSSSTTNDAHDDGWAAFDAPSSETSGGGGGGGGGFSSSIAAVSTSSEGDSSEGGASTDAAELL